MSADGGFGAGGEAVIGAVGVFAFSVKIGIKETLIVIACFAAAFFYACRPDWQFARLERNARKVITPTQLQDWAVNLIATKPTNLTPSVSELATNFPAALLRLYYQPPYIRVQEVTTESPGSVLLMWGGGMIGNCGFEIGPTNFVSDRKTAREWQSGVFFWSTRP